MIGERVVIRPPFKKFQTGFAFFPIHIGDYVVIEDDCIINAATIGSFVHIGKGAIVVSILSITKLIIIFTFNFKCQRMYF